MVRAFLRTYGQRLQAVSYVVTRSGEGKFQDVYRQMDQYVTDPHLTDVSLRPDGQYVDGHMALELSCVSVGSVEVRNVVPLGMS